MLKNVSKGVFSKAHQQFKPDPTKTFSQTQNSEIKVAPVGNTAPVVQPNSLSNAIKTNPGFKVHEPKIITIGGGKGGIGKSFLSANIAVQLGKMGYQVSIVDLDFGAANLHSCLGIQRPQRGLYDFLSSKISSFEEVGVYTPFKGVKLFGGGQEFWLQVRPQPHKKVELLLQLQNMNADYVLIDLGAGTHMDTLDFFILGNIGVVVVVPEPTSIENAYVFIKSIFYRQLQTIIKVIDPYDLHGEFAKRILTPKNTGQPFEYLLSECQNYPEIGRSIIEYISSFQISILMNQVRTKNDIDLGHSMVEICKKYFGFSCHFTGSVHFDDIVWKAIRSRKHVLTDYPTSDIAKDINSSTNNLIRNILNTRENV